MSGRAAEDRILLYRKSTKLPTSHGETENSQEHESVTINSTLSDMREDNFSPVTRDPEREQNLPKGVDTRQGYPTSSDSNTHSILDGKQTTSSTNHEPQANMRFDFSRFFSHGIVQADPVALISLTAWLGGICITIIIIASATLLFNLLSNTIILSYFVTGWLYVAILLSGLIFIIAADLAEAGLKHIDSRNRR